MKITKLSFVMIAAILITSCKQDMAKVVTAVTSKILEPVSMTVGPNPELGEIVVGDNPTVITITIDNNSSDKIQKMKLDIDKTQSLLKFTENSEGEVASPGIGGTCAEELAPGAQCIYKLSFNPRKSGTFEIPVIFLYENLIEPQKKEIKITAVTGEPASLVYTNDITNYNMGIIEQTEKIKRYIDLEIINSGGLSARNVNSAFINLNPNGAFKLEKNECPETIKPKEKCALQISYEPKNNDYNDALIEYKSQLTINYVRDGKGNQSNLNSYAEFLSTTIEAKFKENFKTVDFGTLYSGNKSLKSIKVSNVGYREGIIQEFIITDYQKNLFTSCKKAMSGNILNCDKSLQEFPYIIEDSNNCFEKRVKGNNGRIPGESCIFNVTYWPSLTWPAGSQSIHYFNDMNISLRYDSLWKGEENIIFKEDIFKLMAEFSSAGKMVLLDMSVESIPVEASKITSTANSSEVNLGRIALVSSDTYSKLLRITWKNVGENVVVIDSITDRHGPIANIITETGYDLNVYYKHIKTSAGCGFISPGATCNISFDLAPVLQANSLLEDQLMYDDVTNPLKKIKTFRLNYKDGSSFEDDGTPSSPRILDTKLISKLIKKGSLAFTNPATINVNTVHGKSEVRNLCLTNVGTGDIFAIKSHDTENLFPNGQHGWPFRQLDLSTITSTCPTAATKDCYDILYKHNDTLPMVPLASKLLGVGETCVLSVEVKTAETFRDVVMNIAEDAQRPFGPTLSNTTEAWQRARNSSGVVPISFTFYDGDYVSSDANSFLNYGYTGITKKTNMSAVFARPASIVVVNPGPVSSAVIHRPQIVYPTMTSTYPTNRTINGYTQPAAFFSSTYFTSLTNGFTKSEESYLHVTPMNLVGGLYDTEYKVHIGTFPVGESIDASFDLKNFGESTATNVLLAEAAAPGSPINYESLAGISVKPFSAISVINGASKTVKIKFTPTAAGTFKRCATLTYNNGLIVTDQYMCVYAEAIASAPKIKVQYSDIAVTMGPVETPSGVYTDVTAPINNSDGTYQLFSGIKASSVYVKKIYRFTNIGTRVANKFSYYYMLSFNNAQGPTPADTVLAGYGSKPCTANSQILPNDYCEITVKYQPTKTSSGTVGRFLGMIYEINPGSYQYMTQVTGMNFTALDPAKLSVVSTSPESLNDWSVPTAPLPVAESWPMDLGAYNKSLNTHMKLNALPQYKTLPVYTIKNTSSLKASFLFMNQTPSAAAWNQIYSNSFVTVIANRACFYGDDENNGAIPAAQKGFNLSSVAQCQVQAQFNGYQTYSSCSSWNAPVKTKTIRNGELIDTSCNPYVFKLTYYNNNRASYEDMVFHIKGFIESNSSTTLPETPTFSNVSASYLSGTIGRASFSWPAISPSFSGWGNIVKYRIYYDVTATNLNSANIFKLTGGPLFIETANADTLSTTITNLAIGKYYFFKVVAVRSYSGRNYISDTNLPLLTLPIPLSDHIYHHGTKALIDKTYLPNATNRGTGVAGCTAKFYNVLINGASVKLTKSLITSPMWQYLNTNTTFSSGYPGNDIGTVPHWMGDSAYNIGTLISLYDGSTLPGFPDYVSTSMGGNNNVYKLIYQKTCNNNAACENLFKIVGGDDVDLFYRGTYYAKDTAASAFARCSAVISCPTATAKLITDPTCVQP